MLWNDIKNSDAGGQVSSLTITDEFIKDIENEMTDRNVSEFQYLFAEWE